MYNDTAVIIPALEKNRYSPEGDLVKFGDLSLLEWKITQAKNFISAENIFISTPSRKVEKIAKACGVSIIRRKQNIKMSQVIVDSVKKTKKENILWTHATSPFVSSGDFRNMLNKFLKLDSRYDSLICVSKIQEFIIFKNKALNFQMTKVTDRVNIEPIYRITNGCFVAKRDVCLKYGNYFGMRPYLYGADMLSSMEIKEMKDLTIASDLISLFFKKGLGAI